VIGALVLILEYEQGSAAEAVTMTEGDAAHQRILVGREREIVTEQEMEVSMMETEDAVETLCVAATTASSLELTTMRRTTAARDHQQLGAQGQGSRR